MSSRKKDERIFKFKRKNLDYIYSKYNKRALVNPDPLVFLYDYPDPREREIVGLIASSLAYGRVKQILKDVSFLLDTMKPSLMNFKNSGSNIFFLKTFGPFKHRFTTGDDIAALLSGIKNVLEKYGSLENCFAAGYKNSGSNIIAGLEFFVTELSSCFENSRTYLLPAPSKGSACKRLNLYLRWMIRQDDVDPGGWTSVPASALFIPLDTHMYQICSAAGMTERKTADFKTVIEISENFRKINPEDPVKYDFALTRFGIREELDWSHLCEGLNESQNSSRLDAIRSIPPSRP